MDKNFLSSLLKYSNGWGHFLMSLVCIGSGLIMILASADPSTHATGVGLILTVTGYWFVSSSANAAVKELKKGENGSDNTDNTIKQ